jgi:DNA polymerase III subunit epsilon
MGAWTSGELVAFDLETTGVDRFNDVPVSFALVRTVAGAVITHRSSLVDPGRPIPVAATAVHGITSERARAEGMGLPSAVRFVAASLLAASRRGVPVVGMNLNFDLTMLDCCYRRDTGRGLAMDGFRGPVLDALVLDRHFDRFRPGTRRLVDLCSHYGVAFERAHDAVADACAALDVLEAMCDRFEGLRSAALDALHLSQIRWHRSWAVGYSRWRTRNGLPSLGHADCDWPIAGTDDRLSHPEARVAG